MTATPLTDIADRLRTNVRNGCGEQAETVMRLATTAYLDPERYERELSEIFHRVPLALALGVDLPEPGDYLALDMARRAVVIIRGDDGVARAFVNACRHRGAPVVCNGAGSARRFTCPYHAWVFDRQGSLVGIPQRDTFGEVDTDELGLLELPTQERAGIVFAVLTPGATMDLDAWLGDMAEALELLELDQAYRYATTTTLPSGNWKTTADGYLDGYHIGYLHSSNLGLKQINNRNSWDLYGPHVRLGFANKVIAELEDTPVADWDLTEAMSLVHYVFPNVSISGQPGRTTMVSRIHPGPTVDRSEVVQTFYSRVPIDEPEIANELETRRKLYATITGDEDFDTVLDINRTLPALAATDFLFGRNEPGNQNLHTWVAKLIG